MIEFDEIFEFLREVENTCDNFNEEEEENEKIILFINELKSYINDFSNSLKEKINKSSGTTELDLLEKINNKKKSLEKIILKEKNNFNNIKKKGILYNNDNISNLSNDINNNCMNYDNLNNDTINNYMTNNNSNNVDNTKNIEDNNSNLTIKNVEDVKNHFDEVNYNSLKNCNENFSYNNDINNIIIKTKKNKEKEETKKSISFNLNNINMSNLNGYNNIKGVKIEEEITSENSKKTLLTDEEKIYTTNLENCQILKDDIIKEWSNHIDEYDNLLYEYTYEYKKNHVRKKMEKKNKINFFSENIDEELCLLAQEMKENVLTYREIIIEDNKTLEKAASKQLQNIDALEDVNKKTKKMNEGKNISFFLSLLIIAISILLFILTFFVIVFL
ncbi:conserved Plasmodium protein, unknown function [Plasmodium gallinaceum]|uniref:Uncharacterized protein n=1 Tax=Plasmodium gallinaceum TaxID=5849 RepID=A0A1J1H3Z5_PLAGA|nr:conserved Plasmodium protein, unknown function [Plasmodium gallinaceum]CRG98074.1 conserved Plasmodium protein, unknown function [Plasmodium gallinaceum]